jgi:hypothetical protein
MDQIELTLDEFGRGAFVLETEGQRLAEMEIAINKGELTVFHTEVAEVLKGQGIATRMLAKMVDYARDNQLKVIPLCPFVRAQFQKNPLQYADVWKKMSVKK